MNSDNPNAVYYETLGIDHFLKHYKSVQVGMCRIVDHPYYGLDAYPATIFTNADKETLDRCLEEAKLVISEIS